MRSDYYLEFEGFFYNSLIIAFNGRIIEANELITILFILIKDRVPFFKGWEYKIP
jgi:hypothetical protein